MNKQFGSPMNKLHSIIPAKCCVDNLFNRIGLSVMFNLRLHTCFVLTIFSFWLIVMYKL